MFVLLLAGCLPDLSEPEHVVVGQKSPDSISMPPNGKMFGQTIESVQRGEVVGITDGDTVKILIDNQPIKVRLASIDTPERKQPFGEKAKQKLSELIFRKTAKLFVTGKDRYGRTLGFIEVGSVNVNAEMVLLGYAWHYERYSNSQELQDAQDAAQASELGLWGANEPPVAPWEWRRNKNAFRKS